jgi:tetratricopeptide (TPR) repeat protein
MMLELVSPADPPAQPVPQAPKYWAFLSYSHHDKAVAKRLQRQLETYRLPRRLVGRETSEGPVPARVLPVFRDRDELHAGADLKTSVQDALSRSRWLIVVCTPDAARSPWVNREIIEFKKLRGERHVLALIVRGEPFASDMPGREAEECFPPALRRALTPEGAAEGEPLEPIAADMRKHGDGPQRAMLKLLAGMVGVSFDDLVRRDLQRRMRWMSALVGASMLGVMVFALMAVMAVRARNEAQLQRVQAEGLIEFMLGDLRKKLEPVGRLEVLDSVGEKALAYYGAQDADGLDATALGHRSRAMHLIGEIRDLRGNPAEAQAAFEQAAATTAQLLAKAPNDGQRIFDHAQSVFWVGYTAWRRTDGKVGEAKFEEYLALAQRLVKIDQSNLDWQAEVAFAHVNLGMVQLGTGRPVEALQSLRLAGEGLSNLLPKRPDLRFELAQNLGWQAKALEMLGDYEQALVAQQRKLALFQSMPGGEKNKMAQRGILSSLNEIGNYELAVGRTSSAEAAAQASLKIAEALVQEDPKNLFWRGDACFARLRLVEIQLSQGRRAEAQAQLALASGCVAQFNLVGSLGLGYDIRFGSRVSLLSAALVTQEKKSGLALEIRQFLDQTVPKLTPDTPDRAKLVVELGNAAVALGELQASTDEQAARVAWRLAEAQLRPFEAMSDGAVLTPLARARFYLGDVPGAQALSARIQRSSYRHPAYADLMKQLQAARGGADQHKPQE